MFLNKKYTSDYYNYRNSLLEQAPAVISQDLNTRLKGYLQNDQLLIMLSDILNKYEDGEYQLTSLDKATFGILPTDNLWVKVDKSQKGAPKFFMWIMNEEFIWGDMDMDAAAAILKSGGEGTSWNEKGIVGTIGSFFGGNTEGDAGTDEETIAALAGAFAQIAAEKSIDPQIYFDKLDEVFSKKYGSTIKAFMEKEFGGYGEVVSLNAYRRKIEPSVLRGLNIWTILGDVALTLATFGGSLSFTTSLKGAQVASSASKATKLAKGAASTSTLSRGVKSLGNLTRLNKLFARLDKGKKLAALEKAGIKVGGPEFNYISKGGKSLKAKVVGESADKTKLMVSYGGKPAIATNYETLLGTLPPATATTVMTSAGINLTPAAILAAKKAEESNTSLNPAELMGYYDTLAADPNKYIEQSKGMGASDIASMLLDLKNGSGLFGNTTDQEECSIALLITGLTPEMARLVSAEYKKIDAKMDVYSVLDDELGGDIGIFAKAFWTGCTGEGESYKAAINNLVTKIKK